MHTFLCIHLKVQESAQVCTNSQTTYIIFGITFSSAFEQGHRIFTVYTTCRIFTTYWLLISFIYHTQHITQAEEICRGITLRTHNGF